MEGQPTTFWAKLHPRGGPVEAWHPLTDHCADVAACAEALLARTLLGARLAKLGGLDRLSRSQIARLAALASFHDMGKYNLGFQAKKDARPRLEAGHLGEALGLMFLERYRWREDFYRVFPHQALATWSEEIEGLLVATISHHGRPIAVPTQLSERLWAPSGKLDPIAGIEDLVHRTYEWFPEAWENDTDPLPGVPAFQHGWAGLMMLADWLGSDSDRFFPFAESLDAERMPFARRQAEKALRHLGLEASRLRTHLAPDPPTYAVFPHITEPRPAQSVMLDLPLPDGPSVTVLEAETGSGKTEAAIVYFLRLYRAGIVDGLYFALPTRTAATQIYRRVARAVASAFPSEEHRPPVIQAVPGYVLADEIEGVPLPHFRVQWNDEDRMRYRGWAAEAPKRYLAGAVAVGTVDQALLSALAVSHSHLRSTALLRQLLIVDEVHASDTYMSRLLEAVLDHHVAAGGHALLMSATLGGEARSRLLASRENRAKRASGTFGAACETPYPLVSVNRGGEVEAIPVPPRTGQSTSAVKTVRVLLEPLMTDPEAVSRMALEAVVSGGRVLIIRNTVGGCHELQLALEHRARQLGLEDLLFQCNGVICPHHGRYAKADRKLLDGAIEREFGHERPAREGAVAVATQTVEQSLDLDADFMISDLCPMDVLLQRLGRLHRHERKRPAEHAAAGILVLVPEDETLSGFLRNNGGARGPHGLGSVYQDARCLQATWELLAESGVLRIPDQNRELVERATHPEVLERLVDRLGGLWHDHQNSILGGDFADARHAWRNAISRDVGFDDRNALFPSDRRIPTRLGEDDRRVVFTQLPRSPFGERISELRIPGWTPGVKSVDPSVFEASELVEGADGFSFRYGSLSLFYDRLGLQVVSEEP